MPALLGSIAAAVVYDLGVHGLLVTVATAAFAFVVRLLALRLRWRAPRARGLADRQ